jgi:DNA-binding NarL/FixJ family response regulator
MSAMTDISIALIDDQPLFIEGFRRICCAATGLKLVATTNCTAKLATIVKSHAPCVVVVDVASPANSLDDLSALSTKVRIAALTASYNMKLAVKTLNAGAHGYILKQSPLEEICHALHSIARGEKYITHCVAVKLITAFQEVAEQQAAKRQVKFSMREGQILRLLLDGKTNKAIAGILSITENTVKHYMSILMQKLNARNRVEVVIAAQKLEEIISAGDRVH